MGQESTLKLCFIHKYLGELNQILELELTDSHKARLDIYRFFNKIYGELFTIERSREGINPCTLNNMLAPNYKNYLRITVLGELKHTKPVVY